MTTVARLLHGCCTVGGIADKYAQELVRLGSRLEKQDPPTSASFSADTSVSSEQSDSNTVLTSGLVSAVEAKKFDSACLHDCCPEPESLRA